MASVRATATSLAPSSNKSRASRSTRLRWVVSRAVDRAVEHLTGRGPVPPPLVALDPLERRRLMTSPAADVSSAHYTFDTGSLAPAIPDSSMSWWSGGSVQYKYDDVLMNFGEDGYLQGANGGSLTLHVGGSGHPMPAGDYGVGFQLYVINDLSPTYPTGGLPGTYTITITAASGSLTHTITVVLTVT